MDGDHNSSCHPPLPPITADDRIARLRLLRSRRVGIATYHRLIFEHGSAAAALDALPEIARAKGMIQYQTCPEGVVHKELNSGRLHNARLVFTGEPAYPTALAQIADAPPCFWMIGDIAIARRPCVALVGARNASSNGTRIAAKLAQGLGEAGITVVSGLARGIDAAAHQASLDTGTIAAQAGGVDVIYPTENAALAQAIPHPGMRISEQPIGLSPQARHFPRRNRLISGLSSAVVVIEAAAKSGPLITARQALDQGRDVMAVPGHPIDSRASGCNMLIRDGATLVRGIDDILAALAPQTDMPLFAQPKPSQPRALAEPKADFTHKPLRETAKLHQAILSRIGPAPTSEDQLIRDLNTGAQNVNAALIELELDGQLERTPGGLVTKIPRN